jgi:hypothetical protein
MTRITAAALSFFLCFTASCADDGMPDPVSPFQACEYLVDECGMPYTIAQCVDPVLNCLDGEPPEDAATWDETFAPHCMTTKDTCYEVQVCLEMMPICPLRVP